MSDTLKLAMRISAVDLFSGVLRRFRNEITGTGAAAKAVQRDYDNMVRHTSAGLKSLAVAGYGAHLLKPAVSDAAALQVELLKVESILQGAHPNASKLANEMARVRQNALAVSKDLKYPAEAVVEATRQLVQAGVPLDATLDRIDKKGRVNHGAAYMTELLAETKGVDPSLMAQNIAKVAHSFGVPASGYGEMIDSIAKASTLGSADTTELFYNLNQAGAIAHNLGHMNVPQAAVLAQALAPLGGESPAAVKSLIDAMTGAQARGYKWQQRTGFNFFDKKGAFIGLDAGLQEIEKRVHGMTEKQQDFVLGRSFGGAALPALRLLMAVDQPGVKSYAQMEKDYADQPSLVQQNDTVSKGLDFQLEKLASTNKNTLSVMFDPMLGKMTYAIKLANKLNGAIGEIASKHEGFAQGVSATAAGAIAVAAGYGAYRLAKGGLSLRSFLKGKAGLATGIAEGKAVQAATGVTPVYVTNFPASFGGLPGAAATAAGGEAAAAGAGATAARAGAGLLASSRGFALADLLPAFALGVGIKKVNDLLAPAATSVNSAIAASGDRSQAKALGLTDAQMSRFNQIETHDMPYGVWAKKQGAKAHGFDDYDKWVRDQVRQQIAASAPAATQVGGSIEIKLSQDGRARVGKVTSKNPNVPIDVGSMMALP